MTMEMKFKILGWALITPAAVMALFYLMGANPEFTAAQMTSMVVKLFAIEIVYVVPTMVAKVEV